MVELANIKIHVTEQMYFLLKKHWKIKVPQKLLMFSIVSSNCWKFKYPYSGERRYNFIFKAFIYLQIPWYLNCQPSEAEIKFTVLSLK